MKQLKLPASKSITNRDLILSALADGQSYLHWVLLSDDTLYMMKALDALGFGIQRQDQEVSIRGWVNQLAGNDQEIFVWNSGTCMRFLMGLSGLNHKWSITLTGNDRMKKRPIKDLADAISQMWLGVQTNTWYPPVTISWWIPSNNKVLMNGTHCSQYFTSLLMIAPLLPEWLVIDVQEYLVETPYIDMTINEMHKFGVQVKNTNYERFEVKPQKYTATDLIIEWDASALSYILAFIILHWGQIHIQNLGFNTKQWDYKFMEMLWIFGLEYESDGQTTILKAPGLANIDLWDYADLTFDFQDMPDVSMTFMILSMFIPGQTLITGLQTLNLKECRRIDAMKNEISKLGVSVSADSESIRIGEAKDFPKNTVKIGTYDDHRIAMSFWVLGSFVKNLNIQNPECVAKTYPNFWDDMQYLLS